MKFLEKHSLVHYVFHTSLATFFLFFLIFSENIFSPSLSYGNITFGENTIEPEGRVYKQLSFESKRIIKKETFFLGETFESKKESAINISFSDFSVIRSGENTKFSVLKSQNPEISFYRGKIWVSTKEYVVTYLPQAKVETLAGKAVIERDPNGKTIVIAWDKPSRITFLSKKNEILWQFLLPSQHKVEFSPSDYFSKEDFKKFRFSKLKKEFSIHKAKISGFIEENLGKDKNWEFTVLSEIDKRREPIYKNIIPASLFAFSPNVKQEENEEEENKEVMNIWDSIYNKRFPLLEKMLENFSDSRKRSFYKYAGFFENNTKANALFVKSFSPSAGNLWIQLWTLESMMTSGSGKFSQERIKGEILKEVQKSHYDTEEIQFFAIALFKNHSDYISYAIIDFFYDINKILIEEEKSPEKKLTRKLEIIQDVFSFTDDLIKRKEYLLARKILDEVEKYVQNDNSPLLAEKKKQILKQKNYIRGKVEYAEILGDGDKNKFRSYLSLKKSVKDQIEKNSLHSSAQEEKYSEEKVKKILHENFITTNTIKRDSYNNRLFHFEKEKNKEGVVFSGIFNIDTEKFSKLVFYDKEDNPIQIASHYIFTVDEISQLQRKTVDNIVSAQKQIKENEEKDEEKRDAIPSEIADFVYNIAQEHFIKNDIMVTTHDLMVVSINTANVKNAVAHYSALELQREEERRRKKLKGKKNVYTISSRKRIEEYTLNFSYNIETKKAFNVVGFAYNTKIPLSGEMSLPEVIKILDEKVKGLRKKIEVKDQVIIHLKSIGVIAEMKNIFWEDENTLLVKNMKERNTGVEFDGIYKPYLQKFDSLTFLNISKNAVILKKPISLEDLQADFETQKDTLIEKVSVYGK